MSKMANCTAEELARLAHKARPATIYRAASDGASVAAWYNGRWVPVAGKLIGGRGWASLDYELLINGKLVFYPALYGPAPDDGPGV